MTTDHDCTCGHPGGAHDERCPYIKWVRGPGYEPDLEIPAALRRKKPVVLEGGVFD